MNLKKTPTMQAQLFYNEEDRRAQEQALRDQAQARDYRIQAQDDAGLPPAAPIVLPAVVRGGGGGGGGPARPILQQPPADINLQRGLNRNNLVNHIVNNCQTRVECMFDHKEDLGVYNSSTNQPSSFYPGLCKDHVLKIFGLEETRGTTPFENSEMFNCIMPKARIRLVARKLPSSGSNIAFRNNDIIIPFLERFRDNYEVGALFEARDLSRDQLQRLAGYKFSPQLLNFFRMAFYKTRFTNPCDPFDQSECDYTRFLSACLAYVITTYALVPNESLDDFEQAFLGDAATIVVEMMIRTQNRSLSSTLDQFPTLNRDDGGRSLLYRVVDCQTNSITSRARPNATLVDDVGLVAVTNICEGEPIILSNRLADNEYNQIIFASPTGDLSRPERPPAASEPNAGGVSSGAQIRWINGEADTTIRSGLRNCTLKVGTFSF